MSYFNGHKIPNITSRGESAFIRYSSQPDGTNFTETWSYGQKYIGFATGQTAPTEKEAYTWVFLTSDGGYILVSGVWTFNANVTVTLSNEFGVNFSSNGTAYKGIKTNFKGHFYYIGVDGDNTYVYSTSAWKDEAYRTVDFGTTPLAVSVDFYNWLTDNAVRTADRDWQEITEYIDKEIAEFDFVKVVDELPETGLPNREYFVRKASPDTNDLFDEYAWINRGTEEEPDWDWEFKGTKYLEIDLTDYVKKKDYATNETAGVLRGVATFGFEVDAYGRGQVVASKTSEIDAKSSEYKPIVPKTLDYAVKVGMTTNTIVLTEEEKAAVRNWIGAAAVLGSFTFLDRDEQPHEFTFVLGMTWIDFINSDYNQDEVFGLDYEDLVYVVDYNGHRIATYDYQYLTQTELLVNHETYYCEEIL